MLCARHFAFELEDDNMRCCRPSLRTRNSGGSRGPPNEKIKVMRNLVRLEELVLAATEAKSMGRVHKCVRYHIRRLGMSSTAVDTVSIPNSDNEVSAPLRTR